MRIVYILLFLTMVINEVKSQVSIGNTAAPPKGALLELKNKIPVSTENQLITANKGLILPRVFLQNPNLLNPILDTYTTNEAKDLKGLMVFNVNNTQAPFNTLELGLGVYIWDGVKWSKLQSLQNEDVRDVVVDYMKELSMYQHPELYQPNSYIVNPGQSVNIPAAKAYSMWDTYRFPANSLYAQNKTLNEYYSKNLQGAVSVEIIWTDNTNLIVSGSAGIQLTGTGRDMNIKVNTVAGSEGNAVIGLKIGGTIKWTWHLWVTAYDPEPNSANGHFNHFTNKTEVVIMNRNLGALSNSDSPSSMGLMYQWGRKDPLPGSGTFSNYSPLPIYNALGGSLQLTSTAVNTPLNLQRAIENPLIFYTCVSNPSNNPTDWYTNSSLGVAARESVMNDYLWSENGRKTPFDPCPQGWKVPDMIVDFTPLIGMLNSPSDDMADFANYGGVQAVNGVSFTNNNYPVGFMPFSGCIDGQTGAMTNVGFETRIWTAATSSLEKNKSVVFIVNNGNNARNITPQDGMSRSGAASVRCVKE